MSSELTDNKSKDEKPIKIIASELSFMAGTETGHSTITVPTTNSKRIYMHMIETDEYNSLYAQCLSDKSSVESIANSPEQHKAESKVDPRLGTKNKDSKLGL